MARTNHHGIDQSRQKPWMKPPAGYNPYGVEPSWWHKLRTHQPARAYDRQKMHRVATGAEEDDGNWRDRKKPHDYFW